MAAKTIITPVLKFWGFERHPFDDLVLRGDELDLFIDRKVELRRLQNSLSRSASKEGAVKCYWGNERQRQEGRLLSRSA